MHDRLSCHQSSLSISGVLDSGRLAAEGSGRRDGLDWWPAKGPRRSPGPGPPRALPARSSPWLSSAAAQDDVEGPATDSTPGLGPRAHPCGDLDTFGGCGCRDYCPDDRGVSLARMSQHGLPVPCHPRARTGEVQQPARAMAILGRRSHPCQTALCSGHFPDVAFTRRSAARTATRRAVPSGICFVGAATSC